MTIFCQIPKLSPLPVIARHFAYSAYSGIVRCQSMSCTYSYLVAPFWRWNDVSIFCNHKVISTSSSAAMLTSTAENVLLTVALGKMLLSWCRANNWIWNDVVITETC